MTKELLSRLIVKCENIGINIRAITFDMGNMGFLKDCGVIREKKNCFANPVHPEKVIYLFHDVPHLIKLARKHCLTKGFSAPDENGKYQNLKKENFEEIMKNDGKDLKLCPKLKGVHIHSQGLQNQRVYLATQLFSASVSKALLFLKGDSYSVQASIISKFNKWFDTMNSRTFCTVAERCPFGSRELEQNQAVHEMSKLMDDLRFCTNSQSSTKKPFQIGIQISIRSTLSLFEELKGEGTSFLCTTRLNQDTLESFFSRVRGIGGNDTHPTPVQAIRRIRTLLMGKSPQHIVCHPNVKEDDAPGSVKQVCGNPVTQDYYWWTP